MKTTLTTTILLLLTQFCFTQDFWIQLNLPGDTTLNALAGNSEGFVFSATRKGVYTSLDNGLNWSITEITNSTYRITVDKENRIFASIYPNIHYSTNNGERWNEIICPPVGIMSLYVKNNSIIFGNWGEIYKSSDFGETWSQVLELGNTSVINAFAENPEGVLFAGVTAFMGGGGVYRSTDNGDTWEHAGLHDKYISSLAISSTGVMFAGSRGDHEYGGGGVFRSDDNGITWDEVAYNVWVTSMAIDPNDVLYIGCTLEHGGQSGVFRSADNGESWELLVTGMGDYPSVEGMSLSPDGYLYAYHNKLFRSAKPVYTTNTTSISNAPFLKVFPNPFTDILHIELPIEQLVHGPLLVNVFELTGRQIFSQNLSNLQGINLSSLLPGLYYISIEINGKRLTKPIVKL